MPKIVVILLIVVSACFAQSSELCNPGVASGIPINSCYSEGYVCLLTTESTGGVRFAVGKNAVCDSMETTRFYTHPRNGDGGLDTTITSFVLMPYLQEGPEDNVGALALAVNTAFIINAFNDRLKVRVVYHRVGNIADENSVRLQAIGKAP